MAKTDKQKEADVQEGADACTAKDVAIIAMSFLSQMFAYAICLVIIFHPPDMKDATVATLIGTLIGFALSEAKNWSSYWTGTTRSSSEQQKTISNMAATASGTGSGNGTAITATTTPEGGTTMKAEPVKPAPPPPAPTEPLDKPSPPA